MRRGNSIVIFASVLIIILISFIYRESPLVPIHKVTYFNYPTQHDTMFSSNDLIGKITIADFFFTSCPALCPAMNRYMKELSLLYQNNPDIQFLSISVDPKNDTKSSILTYIDSQKLNYSNWFFLESESESIPKLLEEGFMLSGDGLPGLHSSKFILINSDGEIIHYYDPFLEAEFDKLKKDTKHLLSRL